jgi:hypothetical protein
MKKIILLFMPFIMNAQQSTLTERIIVSEFNVRQDNSINIRKSTQILKDNVVISETYWRTVLMPNDYKLFEVLKGYDDYVNLAIEAWKDITDTTGLFPLNEETDSIYYTGNWRLNVNNVVTNGKIKLNANGKYIFDPNLNQPLIENIPLIIKTNLIKIKINNIDIVLIKNENGKYISNNKNVRLIKLE